MLTHDIYRVCCCLSSYSSYQDILEEHATSKALTATSLLVLQEKAGYRTCNEGEEPSAPASAPSSSSFEPDTSENEAEPQKLAEDNQNSVANSNKNVVANTGIAVANTNTTVANTGIAVANTDTAVANTGIAVANTDTAVANTVLAVANTVPAVANTDTAVDNTVPAVDNSKTEGITNLNQVMRNKTGRNTKDQAADADSRPGDGSQLTSWHPASFAMAQATSRPHTTGRESGDPIPSRSRTTSSEQGDRVRKTSSLNRIRDKVESEERNTARTQAGSLFHALVAKDPDGKGTEITTRESRAQRKAERRQARKEGRTSEDKTEEVKKEEERPVTASSLFHALLTTEQKKNEEQLIRESSQRTAQRAGVTGAPRQDQRPVRMDKESLKQKTEDYVANIPLSKSTDHEPRSRDKSQERSRDKSQERSRDKSQERSRDKSQERSRDKSKERSCDQSQERSRDKSQERPRDRSHDEGGSTGDLVIRPIQRILEVLSGTIEIERSAPDTPDTQQDPETEPTLVLDKEENAEEKEIEEEEEEEEEEEDESINYSDIPTDEISTDPSSEEEEEEVVQNKYLKHAFFPEVYDGEDSDSYPYKRPFTLKSPTAHRQKSSTLNKRYPVYIPSESSSSLATDDLSSESEEDEEGEEELSSHISDLEQEEDELEVELEGNESEGELEEELEEPETGEDVRYDDPDLVETDSAFSFSGRISPAPLNEGNDNEKEIEELEGTNVDQEDTGPPAPSSPGPSTVVGSIVTASSGTFTELRNEDERKRGGGLMKRFKKRVMKK